MHSKYGAQDDLQRLEELGEVLNELDAGDSIVVASAFSHMLSLGNLAQEVQSAFQRRAKQVKKGDIGDENSALTESNLEETFQRLVNQLEKSPAEIFEALKNQTVDLVLTAHPTQSVRRSLLQKHTRCAFYLLCVCRLKLKLVRYRLSLNICVLSMCEMSCSCEIDTWWIW